MSFQMGRFGSERVRIPQTLSDERLAEIRSRLTEPTPLTPVGAREKSPVARYLNDLRSDLSDLLDEVDRLRAESTPASIGPYDAEYDNPTGGSL